MNHTCVAVQHNHQGRCSICQRFMAAPGSKLKSYHNTVVPLSAVKFDKDVLIDKLRKTTCLIEHEKFGNTFTSAFSLEPCHLGNYVGNGKSRQADADTLFLYDVDADHFRRVFVSGIKSVTEL